MWSDVKKDKSEIDKEYYGSIRDVNLIEAHIEKN
jgi:hypothetical protein